MRQREYFAGVVGFLRGVLAREVSRSAESAVRMNALQRHLSKAAKRKAEMLHSGELPASAAGGRKPKPTPCSRCGVEATIRARGVDALSYASKDEAMTTSEATRRGIPRWMVLAMPDDVSQIATMVEIEYSTPGQRRDALRYYLRELRRTQWDRRPGRPARKPAALRPSKHASGYRKDSAAHSDARAKLSPEKRSDIARMGAFARKKEI